MEELTGAAEACVHELLWWIRCRNCYSRHAEGIDHWNMAMELRENVKWICWSWKKLLSISITLLGANLSFKVGFIFLTSIFGNFTLLFMKKRKLSDNCMMVLSKRLLENYPVMLTMLELSEILRFCQTKISEKQFKYFTAVPHYTVIAYLIIQDVHDYLQGKLIHLLFILAFFFKKTFWVLHNLCNCISCYC